MPKKHELAVNDYLRGSTAKEIALKYGVAVGTVKSWKARYKWTEKNATAPEATGENETLNTEYQEAREIILDSLVDQLIANDINLPHYRDLVEDYMALWDIKNNLIADIRERGVAVVWTNGKQSGKKKNDSVNELNKTNKQMLTLLSELGLKAANLEKDDTIEDA
ncbi:P27 family phage terminase small subunit [Niallia nealsonii]|uniref:RNA polymerase subunit sigma-70 n=1 Tax=Niallia nealsonii TaxID=115979 RepID=A0A2N0Z3D1_9BACI|nr:P27 family phage terminase small subunit [Niallia nealsonii]PKG24010.1 RNA polymerase subunit sigma-70 [Niallia nealsonii]